GTVRIANATAAHGSDTFAVAGIEAPIEIHARAMPAGWTFAAGTLDARARAISGTLGGMPVRAREVTLASARPIARGFDLGTLRWTATELAFGELRLAGAAGTVDDQRTVRWHAVAARWHEVRATSPVGTISARRVVGWRAPLVRWREVRIVDVESTITTRELRWRAREASHEGAHLIDPEGTVALDHGEHALAWRRAVAGPLELGHGEIALRTVSGGVQLGRVSVQAYGGQLALAQPGWITVGQPLDLAVHGLQLHDTLRALGLRRIDGRGLLDGHLELHATATGWELGRASLHSRGVGSLRAIDIAWLQAAAKLATTERFGLHHRIAGALADFDYAHLAIELGPRGARPELRVALRGRGKRVWQDLDLVFNVRGVHSTIRHLSHRAPG
ncbi:MAG: YdbH domain-containing protein, partial [Kofleriaceae bacterium]